MKKIKGKNENFFEEIDSEIKAYLLGYFAADGTVSKTNYISVVATIEDRCAVDLMKEFISPNSNLYYRHVTKGAINRKPQISLHITSSKLKEDLAKYKIINNKTKNGFSMELVPEELQHHYIRGYFDGDGSIYYGVSQNRNKVCVNFTNATREIFDEFILYFNKRNIDFKFETKISVKKNIYYVIAIYNKKDIKSFSEIIYKDANYFFQRKYDKFTFVNTVLTRGYKKPLTV